MQFKTQIGRFTAASLAAFVVAGPLVATATPAAAAVPTAGEVEHCVVNLETQATACATSDAEVMRLAGVGPQAVLAVRLYDGINYTGETYDFYVSAPCTPPYDGEYGHPNLGAFSNRASSVRTYNQCDVHLHDPINYGPPFSVWIDSSPNLANIGWNNRASSIGIS